MQISHRVNELTRQLEKFDEVIKTQTHQILSLRDENLHLQNLLQQASQENNQLKEHLEILDREKHNLHAYYEQQVQSLEAKLAHMLKDQQRK